MEEGEIYRKKEKILNWLKNPLNIYLALVLLLAFAIRLYYFVLTKGQPLWWDEAAYGSLAKNWVLHLWDNTELITSEMLIRPPLFSFLWSILMRLSIPETGIKFALEFLPSFLSVIFVYLVGKEVFGKRVAVISTFIFSVLWIHLFYTLRFLTDLPALVFFFPSIYLFLLATKHQFNYKYFAVSLFLLSLSTLMRYPNGLLFFVYLIVLILAKQFYINRFKYWLSAFFGLIPIFLFFIINLSTQGNIFPTLFKGVYTGSESVASNPLTFSIFGFIKYYLAPVSNNLVFSVFFLLFILGFLAVLFELFLGYNLISKSNRTKNYFLIILMLVAFYSFFFFYIRGGTEDRYLFPISISLCLVAGFGVDYVYRFVRKSSKFFALLLIFVLLFIGAYSQITFADNMINLKSVSYLQIRQGFEWIKANTTEDAILTGNQIQAYAAYYSERKHLEDIPKENETELLYNADYLVLHAFVPMPDYIQGYLQQNSDKWKPVKVFYFDSEQTKPALVIYKNEIK